MNTPLRDSDKRFAALLERWASGTFTRSNEAELHRLLADDAFRREAWSGFSALPAEEHMAVLERLKQRLTLLSARRRRRWATRLWAAAAAVFLLLAGTLYWWWGDSVDLSEQAITPTLEHRSNHPEVFAERPPVEETPSRPFIQGGRAPEAGPSTEAYAPPPKASRVEGEQPLDTAASLSFQDVSSYSASRLGTFRKEEEASDRLAPARELHLSAKSRSQQQPVTAPPALRSKASMQPISKFIRPENGWSELWQQYCAADFIQPAVRADSLRLSLVILPDSQILLLQTQPALERRETQQLEQLLQRYRWVPADTSATVVLPPVRF